MLQPHLGTDRLIGILRAFRAQLLALGVNIRWGTAVHSLDITAQGSIAGVRLEGSSHGSDAGVDEPGCTCRQLHLQTLMMLMNAGHAMLLAAPAERPQACMMPWFYSPGGSYQHASAVVLATGHSSRALMQELAAAGVSLVPKPFAMGFRVEHPQVPAACMGDNPQ